MGRSEGIPIPLTYENAGLFEQYKNTDKTIFCSFVGADTHPIRRSVVSEFLQYSDVVCSIDKWTNEIANDKQQLFLDVTSKSKFTLAPRGFGKTSFRLYEALKLGSVPVYIYDDPWLPYTELIDWNKLAVLSHINDVPFLYDRLKNITDEEYCSMLAYYKEHEYLFTFEGMSEYVVQKFNSITQTPSWEQCALPPVHVPVVSRDTKHNDAPNMGLYKTSGNKIQFKDIKY